MRRCVYSASLLLLFSFSNGFAPPKPALTFLVQPKCLYMSNMKDNQHRFSRLLRWNQRLAKASEKTVKAVTSATVAWVVLAGRNPALADMIGTKAPPGLDTSLRANEILVQSLRPDSTVEDAEVAVSGKSVRDQRNAVVGMSTDSTENAPNSKKVEAKKLSKSLYYDDDVDDDRTDELFGDTGTAGTVRSGATPAYSSSSSAYSALSQGPSTGMYIKSAVGILTIPAVWLTTREFLRRRREEDYVKKSMAIMEAQKAEFFNVTATKNVDNITDELKGLKKNSTDTKNDDDSDDDDDEEDDDSDDDLPPKKSK